MWYSVIGRIPPSVRRRFKVSFGSKKHHSGFKGSHSTCKMLLYQRMNPKETTPSRKERESYLPYLHNKGSSMSHWCNSMQKKNTRISVYKFHISQKRRHTELVSPMGCHNVYQTLGSLLRYMSHCYLYVSIFSYCSHISPFAKKNIIKAQ